jgi:hypothetical protein
MRALLIVSLLVLVVSVPPLLLMGREVLIDSIVHERYSVEPISSGENGGENSALGSRIGSHQVQLADDQPLKSHEPFKLDDDRATGMVSLLVDGRAFLTPVAATIRLKMRGASRYWGFVYLQKLVDRQGPDRLVIAENLGNDHYRTVSIFPDGRVVPDEFSYGARCSPAVRALLIRPVVSHPSGYCSDLMQVWPSALYPLLYPWLSGPLGLVGVTAGLWLLKRKGAAR